MKPTQEAFATSQSKGKTYWTRIGVAFANEKSTTLYLDAMPSSVDGQYQIVLLPYKERQATDAQTDAEFNASDIQG